VFLEIKVVYISRRVIDYIGRELRPVSVVAPSNVVSLSLGSQRSAQSERNYSLCVCVCVCVCVGRDVVGWRAVGGRVEGGGRCPRSRGDVINSSQLRAARTVIDLRGAGSGAREPGAGSLRPLRASHLLTLRRISEISRDYYKGSGGAALVDRLHQPRPGTVSPEFHRLNGTSAAKRSIVGRRSSVVILL
jgi:hypothetical protein